MGRISDREQLLRTMVHLHRAGRRGADPDVSAARASVLDLLGPTLPRAMAARALGISQPALERWIRSGDIPVVLTPGGRREVPVLALTELIEAVEDTSARHPLATVLQTRRSRAAALDVGGLVDHEPIRHGHRISELRGLAFHRVVAQRLDASLIADARLRLTRWRAEGTIPAGAAESWEALLGEAPDRIVQRICADDDDGRHLRQSSPFAGSLTEPERRRVLDAVTA